MEEGLCALTRRFEDKLIRCTEEMNLRMKDNDLKGVKRVTDSIFQSLEECSGGRVPFGTWVLPIGLGPEPQPEEGQILWFAHSSNEKRLMGIIQRCTDEKAKAKKVIDPIQFEIIRIVLKEQKRKGGEVEPNRLCVLHAAKPTKWCSTRRGFYAINSEMLKRRMFAELLPGGTYGIKPSDVEELIRIHERYISGMYINPVTIKPDSYLTGHDRFFFGSTEIFKVPGDDRIEQFLLHYPTPEWKQSSAARGNVNNKRLICGLHDPKEAPLDNNRMARRRKTKCPRNKKRFRDQSSVDDDFASVGETKDESDNECGLTSDTIQPIDCAQNETTEFSHWERVIDSNDDEKFVMPTNVDASLGNIQWFTV